MFSAQRSSVLPLWLSRCPCTQLPLQMIIDHFPIDPRLSTVRSVLFLRCPKSQASQLNFPPRFIYPGTRMTTVLLLHPIRRIPLPKIFTSPSVPSDTTPKTCSPFSSFVKHFRRTPEVYHHPVLPSTLLLSCIACRVVWNNHPQAPPLVYSI